MKFFHISYVVADGQFGRHHLYGTVHAHFDTFASFVRLSQKVIEDYRDQLADKHGVGRNSVKFVSFTALEK